jgi:sugar O-acyltransferase (sialic acid O-acetyltransferase NeuD family)
LTDQAAPSLVFLGAGGHARVLQETLALRGIRVHGYLAPEGPSLLDGVTRLGDDSELASLDPSAVRLVNAIGSVAASVVRRDVFLAAIEAGFSFASVIDVGAIVRPSATLGSGAQVLAGAIINSGAILGDDVVVNSGAIVEHHARLGSHVHVSPGAVLGGAVVVGSGSHIGLGSRVLQGITIGSGCTIGAGAVVIHDVADGTVAVGVPAVERAKILS